MLTLVLTRTDVARNTEALTLLGELRQALIQGEAALQRNAEAVTVDTGARSMLHLHERPSGKLLAVMDATQLLRVRAQLVAALAVEALASPEARRVALLGGGPLASGMLKALRLVRSLREVWLVMEDPAQLLLQATWLQTTLKTPVRPVDAPADAVANADVVVLAGGIALPEVALWPSVHLSVPDARAFPQAPLTPGVLAKAWRVGDSEAPFWGQPIQAPLSAVLAGSAQRPPGVNTLFLGSGPPWLDLVAAWHVYQGALADEALTRIDFEA